jgi:hypothetical protein
VPDEDDRRRIDRIEGLIHEEVGRNIGLLTEAARGGLYSAATSIAQAPAPRLGVITGFYVPRGSPPAAETDGPVGVALLLHGLTRVGVRCRVATDDPCRSVCAAALRAVGLHDVPLDTSLDRTITLWRQAGITHVLSIERCGRATDGKPHNLTGLDVGEYTAPLDDLFLAGPWETLAVGDGGNEIGMGSLPRALIARSVANGEKIACVTPARHLLVAGVSNWGAWGLLAALAILRPEWRETLLASLDETLDRTILETTVREGPAVDGVSREQTLTVDRLGMEIHHAKLRAIRAAIETFRA